jgi:hypothetical protein
MFLGGLSIGVASLADGTLDFLNESKVHAEPMVDSSRATTQSGCAILGGKHLKSTNGSVANMIQYISLGSIGEISLREINITADSYTPEVLRFSITDGKNGAEIIPDDSRPLRRVSDGTPDGSYMTQPLRQVRVPDTMLDIIVLSQWEYELRFYRPNQVGAKRGKLYQLAGEPFVIYRFRNPNPPSENRLEATTIKHGIEDKSEYFHDAQRDFWSLTKNGKEVVRKSSKINSQNPCERIETRFEAEGSRVLKILRIYRAFPWGQEIFKVIEDPDGEARTTTYTYFEDRNRPHYTFLKTTTYPDGRVEQHNQ